VSRRIPATLIESEGSLYVSERKVYPRTVHGPLSRLRAVAVVVLLGMFYLFPWLQWDGRQAVLFDLPARQFHVFGITLWPQDFLFLAMLLMMAALALFFFTTLAGRLWCGYACPQTVWTEVFLLIERLIEGDRFHRIKLDAGPWTAEKFARKTSKHAAWVVFAAWTGFTFVGFFSPIAGLTTRIVPFQWSGWELFWVAFYAIATWGNAGFLREQVCKYMCPYARFQSAMFDRNTLLIAYDPRRGEPRGPRRRGFPSVLARTRGLLDRAAAQALVVRAALTPTAQGAGSTIGTITFAESERLSMPQTPTAVAPEDLGDCIDCTLCVQVCPTGIDIRNGLQYECIACGACIDACDGVMERLGYPRGLIRYATQNAIDGRRTRILRPRVWVYGTLLATLATTWAWGISHRPDVTVEALRDRNALYAVVADGIDNSYTLKIANRTDRVATYRVRLDAPPGLSLRAVEPQRVDAQRVVPLAITVHASASLSGRHPLRFVVESTDGRARATVESNFFGPQP